MADGEFDNLTVNNVLTIGADTELYRSDTNVLKTNDEFVGADTIGAGGLCGLGKGYFAAKSGQPGWGFLYCEVNGESYPRFKISADGVIEIGSGSDATLDVNLYRAGPNHLKTDNFFQFKGGTSSGAQATDPAFWAFVDGDSHGRLYLLANGTLQWGSGSDAIDTDLYRAAPHILKTHDKFEAAGGGVFYGVAVGCGHYGSIPYPYETIQLHQNYNLRFCFGITERAVLTNGGQLQLPAQDSSGGMVTGSGVSIEHDAFHIDLDDLRLPTELTQAKAYTDLGHGNILFKNTLSEIIGEREYPDDVYTSLFLVMVQDTNPIYQHCYYPILATDHGLWVEKDIQTYGALFTSSDPGKGSGGGAILMGHGFSGADTDPQFILTDTIGGGSGAIATLTVDGNGKITDVNVTNQGSGYTFADVTVIDNPGIQGEGEGARLAPVIVDGAIQSINVYDGGSGYSGSDTISITNNPHNVLYLKQFDGSRAHLALGDLQAYGALFTSSDPEKSSGGGAIFIGHGLINTSTPPCIVMIDQGFDTLYLYTSPITGALANMKLDTLTATQLNVLNSALSGSMYMYLGKSIANDDCLVIEYNEPQNIASLHLYGESSLSGLIIANGGTVYVSNGIYPNSFDDQYCGNNNYHWDYVYCNHLRYDIDYDDFDALDDLGLVKNYKTRTVIEKGVEREVIDKTSLPHLLDKDGFYSAEATNGFLLGCIKALVLRLEKLEEAGKKQNA